MRLWEITNCNDLGYILKPELVWAEDAPVEELTVNCKEVGIMRRLKEIETDKYTLEVFECNCGFHIGIDATYLDQVADIEFECPSCKEIIDTSQIPF